MAAIVTLDLREFETRLKVLKRPQAPVVRALNRSINSAKTTVVRLVSADLGLKVSAVRDFIEVREATETTLEATIVASARRIPLITFGAKGPVPSYGRGGGVTARLKSGAGRYPHAFIATMRSGHRGVFQRRAKARLPVDQLHGPSVWQAFHKHEAEGLARAQEQLAKNLPHEIQFAMSR